MQASAAVCAPKIRRLNVLQFNAIVEAKTLVCVELGTLSANAAAGLNLTCSSPGTLTRECLCAANERQG